jgi:hypothetical protein
MEWIRLTVADNRRYNVASLLLIDVCVPYLISGQLPIMDLLTNGRAIWLTVISLWQSGVRSRTVGNVVRENVATVLFFKDLHLVGGKAVGTRGPGQGVQVGDAVPA